MVDDLMNLWIKFCERIILWKNLWIKLVLLIYDIWYTQKKVSEILSEYELYDIHLKLVWCESYLEWLWFIYIFI